VYARAAAADDEGSKPPATAVVAEQRRGEGEGGGGLLLVAAAASKVGVRPGGEGRGLLGGRELPKQREISCEKVRGEAAVTWG